MNPAQLNHPNNPPTNGEQSSSHYLEIQAAHNKYFQDLVTSWNEMLQQFQIIQIELERRLEQAWQTQDSNTYQLAWNEYQTAFQSISMDGTLRQKYNEAFREYIATIKNAMANANVDELHFTDIARISQSLSMVSQYAMVWRMPDVNPNPPSTPFPQS